MRDQGMTYREIANACDVSKSTIYRLMPKDGKKCGKCGKKGIDTEEVLRLHNEGMNNMEIARELGCSEMTVRYHLKKGEGRVDFSERVKRVDTLPVVEPVEEPVVPKVPKVSKVAELPEVWGGMVTMSRVDEIGNDKRRYRVVFDNDKVTVTLVTASGIELTMDYEEIAGMGNELAAIHRRYGDNPTMTWEAV
jgi:DNA-binding CsgD family transcriptional regulator